MCMCVRKRKVFLTANKAIKSTAVCAVVSPLPKDLSMSQSEEPVDVTLLKKIRGKVKDLKMRLSRSIQVGLESNGKYLRDKAEGGLRAHRGKDHVRMKAETGVKQPGASEHLEPAGAGANHRRFSVTTFGGSAAWSTP